MLTRRKCRLWRWNKKVCCPHLHGRLYGSKCDDISKMWLNMHLLLPLLLLQSVMRSVKASIGECTRVPPPIVLQTPIGQCLSAPIGALFTNFTQTFQTFLKGISYYVLLKPILQEYMPMLHRIVTWAVVCHTKRSSKKKYRIIWELFLNVGPPPFLEILRP